MTPRIAWMPDETLFSLASRVHQAQAFRRDSETAQLLFGHPRVGTRHDFPSGLDCFVRWSGGTLGTADEVVRSHTSLAIYLPFAKVGVASRVLEGVRWSSPSWTKARLGLLASRFATSSSPLRACPVCLLSDACGPAGFAYWHRAHQLPGVLICLDHSQPLLQSVERMNGVSKFKWCTPSQVRWAEQVQLPLASRTALHTLALGADQICQLGQEVILLDRLAAVYRRQATVTAVCTASGQIRMPALRRIAEALSECLPDAEPFVWPVDKAKVLTSVFTSLLRDQKSTRHPLAHLLLAQALFGDWKSAIHAYRSQNSTDQASIPSNRRANTCAVGRDREIEAVSLMRRGVSVSAAARAVGADPVTGSIWAMRSGITCMRRPQKVEPSDRSRAIRMLKAGAPKDQVAAALSVSASTVTKILRTTPGLQATWHRSRHDMARGAARETIERCMREHPSATRSEIRRIAQAAFAWLYRNDRAWLQSLECRAGIPGGTKPLDRTRIDELLSLQLSTVLKSGKLEPISLNRLCVACPGLRQKLSLVNQLPKTRAALRAARQKPCI